MNIELKPRIDLFSAPAPAPANDNAERWRGPAPQRRRVVIYKPAKSAMTSGRAGTKQWLLEYERQSAPFIEPLMGWTGSTDPMAHMRLTFPTREAAVAYAKRQDLEYEVREAGQSKKPDVSAAKSQAQPQRMALWPIEVPVCDWSDLLIAEVGSAAPTRDLAA
jgi:ETC complex I subunit conserved region